MRPMLRRQNIFLAQALRIEALRIQIAATAVPSTAVVPSNGGDNACRHLERSGLAALFHV
jgi:hypothetical protein